ncbi:hypothetical protein PG997_002067 [Apiospora hydei]|uniref:Uncharacterized protein n=1 Tax=Apiospora hydei TaxID=1337664 RepID=A0ABR1X8B8_9PEZI
MWVVVAADESIDDAGDSRVDVGDSSVGDVGSEENVEPADEEEEIEDDAECLDEDLASALVLRLNGCGWNWNGLELWKPRVDGLICDGLDDPSYKELCGFLSGFAEGSRVCHRTHCHEQEDDEVPVYTRPDDKTSQGITGMFRNRVAAVDVAVQVEVAALLGLSLGGRGLALFLQRFEEDAHLAFE